jgi:hypothetical protein
VNWWLLNENPAAIHLIEAALAGRTDPTKIYWNYLSCNPAAIHLLEANIDKIDWGNLSKNSAAIHLIEAALAGQIDGVSPHKICWGYLS